MTDDTTIPIVVHATPTQPQIEAAIRQAILVLGPLVGVLGATSLGKKIGLTDLWSQAALVVGPLATIISFVWGQYETRKNAQKAATMATALPDSLAKTK